MTPDELARVPEGGWFYMLSKETTSRDSYCVATIYSDRSKWNWVAEIKNPEELSAETYARQIVGSVNFLLCSQMIYALADKEGPILKEGFKLEADRRYWADYAKGNA